MKVLILSCNTGGGHNAAASALKESLNFYHHEAEVLDLMSLGRKHTSALVGGSQLAVEVCSGNYGLLVLSEAACSILYDSENLRQNLVEGNLILVECFLLQLVDLVEDSITLVDITVCVVV